MRFEFHSGRIIFGPGSIERLLELTAQYGNRVLAVTGANSERVRSYLAADAQVFSITGEPTLSLVREGVMRARELRADVVIGIGGGSAIDAAKAIASLTPNSGEPLDYLEVIGKGLAIPHPGLPIIAVPTTAGTGAEVTRNAVLGSPEHGLKASLRGPSLLPALALIDPELTISACPSITATTGLDALTQLLEAFVSSKAGPITDALCRDGLGRVAKALRRAYHDGNDRSARETMAYASLLSGLALANAGLGVIHGFAAPLGGMLNASHGSICAAVLVAGTKANLRALRSRQPDHPSVSKYREAAELLMGKSPGHDVDLVESLQELTADLRVLPLRALALSGEQIPDLVAKAARANSMKANPIELTFEELESVARESLAT